MHSVSLQQIYQLLLQLSWTLSLTIRSSCASMSCINILRRKCKRRRSWKLRRKIRLGKRFWVKTLGRRILRSFWSILTLCWMRNNWIRDIEMMILLQKRKLKLKTLTDRKDKLPTCWAIKISLWTISNLDTMAEKSKAMTISGAFSMINSSMETIWRRNRSSKSMGMINCQPWK